MVFATISGADLFPSPDSDYRLQLTSIWLMRTDEVEANLLAINELFRLPIIADIFARKLAGPEQVALKRYFDEPVATDSLSSFK